MAVSALGEGKVSWGEGLGGVASESWALLVDLSSQVIVVIDIQLNEVFVLCVLGILLSIDELHSLERAENALCLV